MRITLVAFRDGVLCHQGPTEDIIRTDVLRDIYGMDIAIEPYGDKKICVYYEWNFLNSHKQQTITNNIENNNHRISGRIDSSRSFHGRGR